MSIKKDAEELCLKVDDPWSDAMIQEAIDAKLNEDAEKPKKPTPKKPTKAVKVIRNVFWGSLQGVRQNCSAWGRVHPDRCRPKRRKRRQADRERDKKRLS